MDQIGQNFGWGVVSGAIGSIIAVWVLYLLKPLWKRINAPTPLTVQAKLQIAQYLEYSEQALRRLDHMAAHPKDLYLYLFQITLTSLLLICAGFVLGFVATFYPVIQLFSVLSLLCFIPGVGLSIAALVEAQRMSEKKIAKTRAKVEASIRDARSKLGNLGAIIPASTETASPESPDSAPTAPEKLSQ
jgi:hypothetical protein